MMYNTGSGDGRYGGRGRGRGGRTAHGQVHGQGGAPTEHAVFRMCRFFAKGNCSNGTNCTFQHIVAPKIRHYPHSSSHHYPVKGLRLYTDTPDGIPKLLTGSTDNTIKLWNITTEADPVLEHSIPVNGEITDIEVIENNIMWATNEPISQDLQDLTVGVAYLVDRESGPIAMKRSDEMPYTDPFGHIISMTMTLIHEVVYIITGGGDGVIRLWRYDRAQRRFDIVKALEGHFRPVTSLVLQGAMLWSGSLDHTMRIWDLNTAAVVKLIPGGAVTCMITVPPLAPNAEANIISGGLQGEIKKWKLSGDVEHFCNQANMVVTALNLFQHESGLQLVLAGFEDGSISARNADKLELLFTIEALTFNTKHIRSIVSFPSRFSCFATASDDGQVIIWQLDLSVAR